MSPEPDAPEGIGFFSIAETRQRAIGDFVLDPTILLPVEFPAGQKGWNLSGLSWEAIISGVLKFLAWNPHAEHADYYRRLVLAVKPDIKDEFTHLGITTARNGDLDLAAEIFRALEGLFPEDALTAMNLALVYDQRARRNERLERRAEMEEYQGLAFEAYKRALAADPSQAAVHYNFAFFYFHQRSFEKAREHFTEFLKLGTDTKMIAEAKKIVAGIDSQGLLDSLFRKAYDYIAMGKEEDGIAAIREFLASHAEVANAWFLLGWGMRRLGRYAEGKEAFLKALSLEPPHPDLLNELAICLMELGDVAESRKRLEEAFRMEPENTKIICNLGVVAMKSGNTEEAKGFFRTVLEIDPQDPVAPRYLEKL